MEGWPKDLPFPYILWTYPTTFYEGETETEIARETGLYFLSKGDGVVFEHGSRYRVRESWLSFDKNGRWGIGMHVLLDPVEDLSEEDTLGRLAPDYFGIGPPRKS